MLTQHELGKVKKQKESSEQRIIVIGASSGGLEALKKIIKHLPADFPTPIFVVWHMSSQAQGILPQILNRENKIVAAQAYDREPIKPNRIYIAPPDYHMLVEDGVVRTTHGPKENRFRPAVDPLFRSAAYTYGPRTIGVVLSGALDDGTAGLWAVKHYGGTAVVQDPSDAEFPSMPASAFREVKVDYCVPSDQMGGLLERLSKEVVKKIDAQKDPQTKKEIEIAAEGNAMEKDHLKFGALSPLTCPECHGVLSRLHDDKIVRYRCHTGHAYSVETLMIAISESVEDSLYSALRAMDESVILMNHMGDHYAECNQPKLSAVYFKKAKEASERANHVRKVVHRHEHMSKVRFDEMVEKKT